MEIRLQKRIADSGYCSRRAAEALMEEGKVSVNGKVVTKMGSKVTEDDVIEVRGKKLKFSSEKITIALHKPADVITSKSDPHHKNTVMGLLPPEYQHLKPVGRLDKDSEGLLLLSSDGELIQRLTHPKFGHEKVYEVLVKGFVKENELRVLETGKLKLDDKLLQPMYYKVLNSKDRKTWLELRLKEGRNRQIRRVLDALGFPVVYLKRISIGKLRLGDIPKGAYRVLGPSDLEKLKT